MRVQVLQHLGLQDIKISFSSIITLYMFKSTDMYVYIASLLLFNWFVILLGIVLTNRLCHGVFK